MISSLITTIFAAALIAVLLTIVLAIKSLKDFTSTGPQLRDEVLKHYRFYLVYSFIRLMGWTCLISFVLALIGTLTYLGIETISGSTPALGLSLLAGLLSVAIITTYRFARDLLYLPANIEASSNYRLSRFYPLWKMLSPARLRIAAWLIAFVPLAIWVSASVASALRVDWAGATVFAGLTAFAIISLKLAQPNEPRPIRTQAKPGRLNILMIGSDSLRADRVNSGYRRDLTPFIDRLAKEGTHFRNCFVSCARTAPSLASMLTGTWPQRHGIRDNFVADTECAMNDVPSLVDVLRKDGYRTLAISDWCGADFGKLDFGFEECDLPSDQWNIKYLLRQGPKDIRLFLSFFVRNRLGKRFLPELYYLAGVPTTQLLGRDTRAAISEASGLGKPFFINTFMSTTHGPFGSEYPYYTLFPGANYAGCSKFVMSGLNEPSEVVLQQGYTKDKFDLEQIIDLYDGCVRNFDDEVNKIVAHLNDCGLADTTIVVIYSDHGMEFFEHETWGQGNSVVIDESARIPLIIVDPMGVPGRKIDEVVRTIDLAPTLLELSGHGEAVKGFDGSSLASVVRGQSLMPDLGAYYETGIWFTKIPGLSDDHLRYPDLLDLLEVHDKTTATIGIKQVLRDRIIAAKDRALRSGKWKLVCVAMQDGPKWQLFDTLVDPGCTRDIGHEFPEVLKALREQGAALWSG